MEEPNHKEPLEIPGVKTLTDVRMRMRRAAERGLTAQAILDELRERILNAILFAGSAIGVLAYLPELVRVIGQRQWFYLAVNSLAIVALLVVTFVRRIPFAIRAGVMLALLYSVGLSALLASGLHGSGPLYLLALPVLAVILLGLRGRTAGLLAAIGAMAIIGLLMVTGAVPAPQPPPGVNADPIAWTLAIANFALLAIAATISLSFMLSALRTGLQKQQYLTEDLERERITLENRISERTQDLDRRLLQIRTAAEISRTISTELDVEKLLPEVCELVKDRFELYYVGVFLLQELHTDGDAGVGGDPSTELYAVLVAGTGDAGRQMLAAGHKLVVGGDSMIGWSTAYRQARIALDVGVEAVRFSNPYLPATRSELALPILVQEQVLGAITIQSVRAEAFDENDIVVLQSIADSLGSAIVNARLLSELQGSLDEIQSLHSQYLRRAWADALESRGELAYTYQSPSSEAATGSGRALQVPIRLRGQVIGSMTLEAEGSGSAAWSPEELALIETIANQAALALENARLLEETQRSAELERVRAGISSRVWASPSVETILRNTLEELGASFGAAEGLIQLEAER